MLEAPRTVIDRYMRDQAERMLHTESEQGICRVELLNEHHEPIQELVAGMAVTMRVHWNLPEPVVGPVVTLDLVHDDPRYLISTPGGNLAQLSSGDTLNGETAHGSGVFDVQIERLQLPIGMYRVNAAVKARDAFIAAVRMEDAVRFEVRRPADSDSHALLELPQRWSLSQPTEAGAPPKP